MHLCAYIYNDTIHRRCAITRCEILDYLVVINSFIIAILIFCSRFLRATNLVFQIARLSYLQLYTHWASLNHKVAKKVD